MTSGYLNTLEAAFYLFPLIAAIITIPYLIYEYRRFGGIPAVRSFLFYSFILYLTCCYILVVFPLPTLEEVSQMTGPTVDLRFFGFIDNIREYTNFVLTDPSTWAEGFKSVFVYEPFYNLLMLIPFGIYMRYYFRCGWGKTIFFGFLLSLSFELLQLSALFGLYPRPYRLFQVDDLLMNTIGAALGWILSPAVTWMLPGRSRIDEISYAGGNRVTVMRRVIALLVDGFILAALMNMFSHIPGFEAFDLLNQQGFAVSFIAFDVAVFLYFVVLPWFTRGRTPGKAFVGIRVVDEDNGAPGFRQLLIRYGLEIMVALPAPILAVKVYGYTEFTNSFFDIFLCIVSGCFLLFFIVFSFQILISLFTGNMTLWSEKLSHTRIVSIQKDKTQSGRDKASSKRTGTEPRMSGSQKYSGGASVPRTSQSAAKTSSGPVKRTGTSQTAVTSSGYTAAARRPAQSKTAGRVSRAQAPAAQSGIVGSRPVTQQTAVRSKPVTQQHRQAGTANRSTAAGRSGTAPAVHKNQTNQSNILKKRRRG